MLKILAPLYYGNFIVSFESKYRQNRYPKADSGNETKCFKKVFIVIV